MGVTCIEIAVLEKAIRAMCVEVGATCSPCLEWRQLTEEELLYEASVCIFGSQVVFEAAVATADRLRTCGLFRLLHTSINTAEYQADVRAALADPLTIELDGMTRSVMPRFRNRFASLLASTVGEIHGRGSSLRDILVSATSARHARETLIGRVWGFGPKQASLFLRRVGYSADMAILDRHVLEYLSLAWGLSAKPSALSRLLAYEEIEGEFRRIASDFGHSVGCLDLATWVTMRVAKRIGAP